MLLLLLSSLLSSAPRLSYMKPGSSSTRERAQKCILSKSQEARENPVQTQILVSERPLEFLKLGGVQQQQQQLSPQKSFNFHMVLVDFKKVMLVA